MSSRGRSIAALVLLAACARAPGSPPRVAPRAASAALAAPTPTPARDSLAVRIEGEAIWVDGARVELGQLFVTLERARAAVERLDVKLRPDSNERALAELLAMAPKAGFKETRLERAGEVVTVSMHDSAYKPRLMAWVHEGRLVGYDLEETATDKGLFGPFQLTDEGAVADVRRALALICRGQPCQAELDMLSEEQPGDIWQTLRSWQRAADGLPTFSSQVFVIAPHTPARGADSHVRYGARTLSGRLPPVVIQRIVRKNFESLRRCYEAGLGRNAELTGRVTVKFVIGRDGKVTGVEDGGSDIPDPDVRSCVIGAFGALEFPPPANGIVTVVYPVMFAPG